jgi:hypothetical protein
MTVQDLKRRLSAALMLLPLASSVIGRGAFAMSRPPASPGDRFRGMGLTLVVDAVPGAEMLGVEFFSDGSEVPFFAKSRMVQRNRGVMSFPGGKVPETVRVTWRENDSEGYRDQAGRIRYSAQIVGDYTIPIASRIPDEVVDELRRNGGGLRLKFRLKTDGVLFGWDIERFEGGMPRHLMPGGDFLQTWY